MGDEYHFQMPQQFHSGFFLNLQEVYVEDCLCHIRAEDVNHTAEAHLTFLIDPWKCHQAALFKASPTID